MTDSHYENSRLAAAELLLHAHQHGDWPTRLLEVETANRAFMQEMVFGVVRHERALEWILHACATRKNPDAACTAICLVGLYQLLMMDHVEPYAAVNETVEASKTLCGPGKSGFVNAVLRRALREKDQLLAGLANQPPAIRYSHPDDLVRRWQKRYGKADTEALCAWNNQRAETILRLRPMVIRKDFIHQALESGMPATPHTRNGFVIWPNGHRLNNAPGYEQGWFIAQDPATLAAVELCDTQPGERVLDACAAPGGKSIALADQMKGNGTLLAADFNALRMGRLHENIKRCHADWIQVLQMDATQPDKTALGPEPFDCILLDVPCSNTGVIRRRPEARHRITTEYLDPLLTLQAAMLDAMLPLVRTGGRLIYSTCSLEPEENEQQIANVLKRHPAWRLADERRHFPPKDQTDGAYAARLEKK